ncbi:hypothetical protein L198_01837 [Cryptococcus wingfieldii CBS 7118]|uniref:Uncharacterized protein n=1 Tax=Cryptococcus wingfieldii CBS 7118 TaxID=1295528 RepID=A0A1E3JWB7_9TREE|nr:hypothetical protein L198_01837 [Cryptococcus wingfieldii CBS 7118]ODO05149.1 hypothetical protein L198_01837 [Cryptococcus wingfieldii CBS 7118]
MSTHPASSRPSPNINAPRNRGAGTSLAGPLSGSFVSKCGENKPVIEVTNRLVKPSPSSRSDSEKVVVDPVFLKNPPQAKSWGDLNGWTLAVFGQVRGRQRQSGWTARVKNAFRQPDLPSRWATQSKACEHIDKAEIWLPQMRDHGNLA